MIDQFIFFPEKNVSVQERALLASLSFEAYKEGPNTHDFRGYIRRHREPQKIIMMFHGNAGHAAHRIYMASGLLSETAILYLAEYPGYGARVGRPSEESIYQAAADDLACLHKEFGQLPVIVIGESLGTAVTTHLAGACTDVRGMILVSPFTSLAAIGKIHYPFLPVKTLLADKFNSAAQLKNTTAPLLFIHGDQDDIVPFAQGEQLYHDYAGPKEFVCLTGAAHNDLPWHETNSALWQGIHRFFSRFDL